MAKKKTKTKSRTTSKFKKPSLKLSSQQKLIFGSLLIILGILLFIAFLSFFFTGKADQSTLDAIGSREVEAENWLNKLGAWVSDLFITKGFGVSSFIFSGLLFLSGVYITLDINKSRLRKHWVWGTLIVIWLSNMRSKIAAISSMLRFKIDPKQVITEILLITVGILISIQIDSWYNNKVEQQEINSYLVSIQDEFEIEMSWQKKI